MRIGIICEGPTDVHALVCFLQESLTSRGIEPIFVMLQPTMDRTGPAEGGWNMVMKWLQHNPPSSRIKTYFDGGLFDSDLSAKTCDVMILQMDADILPDSHFQHWIRRNLKREVVNPDDPIERGNEVRAIVEIVGEFDGLSPSYFDRHKIAPAVESTETWCIAVFRWMSSNPELLRGQELCQRFMTVLHQSENRPAQNFVHINKDPHRRLRFCRSHSSSGFGRLEAQCHHYRELVNGLYRWGVRNSS